jgi:hypothetical protein
MEVAMVIGKRRSPGAIAIISLLALLALAPAARGASTVGTGTHPWVVVLCNFSDQTATPHSKAYYEELFSDAGAGKLGELDYWHDVSFGQLSISGTTVTNWAVARDPETNEPLTRGEWIELEAPFTEGGFGSAFRREDMILACADGASGITWSNYWGVVAIFPEARSRLAGTISAGATTATLTTTENFPNGSAPFLMGIGEGNNAETVRVTAISGNEVTIERAQAGTTAKEHTAGASIGIPGDLGGVGAGQLGSMPIQGSSYTIATIILPHQIDVEGASHEMGHGHGYIHSRRLTLSTTDYNDCYDLMSVYTCVQAFSANPLSSNFQPGSGVDFGGSGLYNTVLGEPEGSKGSGLDAINLDFQGWIPGPRHDAFDNSVSKQETIRLHSLGDPNALSAPSSEYLEARVPAEITIQNQSPEAVPPTNPPTCSGTEFSCTKSKYYSIEYRERAGWDRGFVSSGVFLHLFGEDNRSYWVDQTPQGHGGLLIAGDEYVDAANKSFVAVNAIDPGTRTAQVTLGSRKIEAALSNLGPASGEFNDPVTLAADLSVSGSGAPVPNQPLVLSLGTQSCVDTTDASGHASCTLTINQHPGSYSLGASFAGDTAYASASASTSFTIEKEESEVEYTGALESDYHDAFTASAHLSDPEGSAPIAGKTITFTLGVGDTCSDTTDALGNASCSITPTQVPGPYEIEASFGPDEDYESSSDSRPFTINKEETTTAYIGPTVILSGGSGVTLEGELLEDGVVPIEGRELELSLGGQSCTGVTDAAGIASCTIIYSGPLGSQPLVASFAGDAYYLPSEDSTQTAIVFAFPDHGAFALGDTTAASAGPGDTVTWWAPDWAFQNSLSGAAAPPAFKGFVSTVSLPTSTPPAACGGPWTSQPGNSSSPPDTVPSYMGVLVSSSMSKSGSTISGDTTSIVVVATDPDYGPAPGHRGTGTVVATYC